MSATTTREGTKVLIRAESNLGYAADDVEGNSVTLGGLLEAIQDAVTEWGEDAQVVLFQTNNQYGANYGRLAQYELFEAVEDDDEEDEDDE